MSYQQIWFTHFWCQVSRSLSNSWLFLPCYKYSIAVYWLRTVHPNRDPTLPNYIKVWKESGWGRMALPRTMVGPGQQNLVWQNHEGRKRLRAYCLSLTRARRTWKTKLATKDLSKRIVSLGLQNIWQLQRRGSAQQKWQEAITHGKAKEENKTFLIKLSIEKTVTV